MSRSADSRLSSILEEGRLDGAFFLTGDATRLVEEGLRRLVDAACDPATRDFNLDLLRGSDLEPDRLASALAMPPVMAERRAVVVQEAQELSTAARSLVERSLAALPPGLCFIVTARVPERSRAAFYRRLRERCTVLEWPAPAEAEVPGWLAERARSRYGVRLERPAAETLAAAVGTDPDLLDVELAKVADASEGKVSVELVRQLVPNVRPVDRWKWLDRVASREYAAALRELPALLAEPRESAVGLLAGLIEGHICMGLAVEGGRRLVADTLREAGKPYLLWKARVYAEQARRWRAEELETALALLRRADRRAKSSGGGDAAVLEELLLSLGVLARGAA